MIKQKHLWREGRERVRCEGKGPRRGPRGFAAWEEDGGEVRTGARGSEPGARSPAPYSHSVLAPPSVLSLPFQNFVFFGFLIFQLFSTPFMFPTSLPKVVKQKNDRAFQHLCKVSIVHASKKFERSRRSLHIVLRRRGWSREGRPPRGEERGHKYLRASYVLFPI